MNKSLSTLLLAAIASVALQPAVAAEKGTPSRDHVDANGIHVSVGADWVSPPVVPEKFFLDARTRPIVPVWKPGDPVKEIPRLFDGDPDVLNLRAKPVNPVPEGDLLVELQRAFGAGTESRAFTTPLVNQDAQGFSGVSPPDPTGDVGGGFYVQAINGSGGATYVVHNTLDGTIAAGPFNMDGLGSGGSCASGFGDPIVVFDQLANRWLLTEFSQSGNNLCVYISADSNPVTTTWMRYAFVPPSFPDYPKYGVWPDAYYVGANENNAVYALDRTKMLAGLAATLQRKTVPDLSELGFQMLPPASINGIELPPAGAPAVFMRQVDDERNNPGSNDPLHDRLELFSLHVDFTTPANTTLTGPTAIQIADFDRAFTISGGFGAIPQPGTSSTLDPLLEVIMFPLHYRSMGGTESIVGNFVTKIGANNLSAIRWFELRRTGGLAGSWSLYQEGTYAPADSGGPANRWMGASAMDSAGNIAMGFSIDRVSPAIYPGLSYVGRMAGDPSGVMTTAETPLVAGASSQNGDRWGDYFQLGVDPIDGCTFWFTGEYMPAGGSWRTRIASFRFDACGTPTFTLSGAPLTQSVCAATATPVALAPVNLTVGSVSGYNTPVNLGFGSGLPTGFTGSYSTTPVIPPGNSVANLMVTNAATPGANALTLRGSSGGTDRDLGLDVNVVTQLPPTTSLILPANNAANVSSSPVFSWSSAAQSESYLIEIATDAGFSNVILSQTVAGTSFQPAAALPTNTQIFWRVTANNICGSSASSAVFSFTTLAAPGDCSAGSVTNVLMSDDMESGAPGWTHSAAAGTDTWALSTNRATSPTHSWFVDDPGSITDRRLDSPSVALPTTLNGLNLQFQHWRDLENSGSSACFDAGLLEISIDGGAFTQVMNSEIQVGPYTGAVSTSYNNPIAGKQAWCDAIPFERVVVDLAPYAGHDARFRFRFASDRSVGAVGWNIDDVKVQGCSSSDLIFADGFELPPP
ncbi:MAG TPA: hypothetical protein VFN25_04555 [Dokdonella sp.]|uniref:hypothetical protein n=1 Tax=Dokdonella sp. TaxID=2291710 RepID=UPI002D7FD0CD|nr:hypothetical protein [Dokdonella sp.]HET9032160.1 hypothetical protein [Dokdonella sp.]